MLSQVTLPWFYAHWILIGSLSRVLLAELFSDSDSPGGSRHRQRLADQERQIFGAETERQRLRLDDDDIIALKTLIPINVAG